MSDFSAGDRRKGLTAEMKMFGSGVATDSAKER
jgi:hypothetical protein